ARRSPKPFEAANHPFVDRCAFLLDSSFLEKARMAASCALAELENLAVQVCEASGYSNKPVWMNSSSKALVLNKGWPAKACYTAKSATATTVRIPAIAPPAYQRLKCVVIGKVTSVFCTTSPTTRASNPKRRSTR